MYNYGPVNTSGGTFYKRLGLIAEDERKFKDAVKHFENGENSEALLLFKDLIINYSESEYAKKAFYYIMLVFEDFDKNGMNEAAEIRGEDYKKNYHAEKERRKRLREDALEYFREIKSSLNADNVLMDRVDVHLLYWLERNDRRSETEAKYDELISSDIPNELKDGLIFNKALYYIHRKNNIDGAIALLLDLANKDNDISESARDQLIALGDAERPLTPPSPQATQTLDEGEATLVFENYPNPFNPATTFSFHLPETGHFVLKIYDIRGREVVTLVDRELMKGSHEEIWSGQDNFGMATASGVYICQLSYQGKIFRKKILLAR